ncbi:MAG: reverse transcriptase family protein [Rickettsiaceae bacterium]|nr:MAG: reverse transcriptase family protein [Rickettsiaceae bacterium]
MDALDAPITTAEVEKALPKLSNGKATGRAGWPAELLRHAAYHIQLDDGRRLKVWMLSPILTSFLNACFMQGRLPSCMSSALVTPIHKKGAVADPANYRPIAVGEPLYRLYTIILNARLVAWSEEHGLRSPVQAGFRPRQSAIHHLFALRHFIDRAILQRRPLFVAFVDLPKAYDTVQHDLLWQRLRAIGVGARVLAAIRSLYASGTLSMKVGGTAGPPRVQQNGVRQGCPLSPTLFGIFFDGLHGHLDGAAPQVGIQLDSGRWVSSLVYADDVVLLSWSSAGLQALLDGMHGFCHGLGLTVSPSKTEVVVFNGIASDTWHVGRHQLPQSASFKYLGLVFHESGSMSSAFAKLAQNGKGAAARLNAKHKALMCNKSFPMMRRLFDAVVRPTVSYGCEVWAPACSQPLSPELKDMLGIQISFFRQLCHLKRSVTPNIIFREFSEGP